jgi:hypothetical protein
MRGIVSALRPTIGAMPHPIVALHDSRTLAALAGAPAPHACELVAAPLGSPGAPLGAFVGGNPLDGTWAVDAELPGGWVLAWSGTLGESLFEGGPANWMRGPAALDAVCDELAPQLARHGKRLVLVPHARHVLSDARSALTWWCERVIPGQDPNVVRRSPEGARSFGLALDPAALLEPSMVPDVEDHVQSLLSSFGPRIDLLVLRDARADPGDPESLTPCSLGDGVLPRDRVLELVAKHVPESTPIAVPGASLDRALAWLGHLRA